jgi:NodT family efflux transporter outer membrane factor (OMF) lipoprotein
MWGSFGKIKGIPMSTPYGTTSHEDGPFLQGQRLRTSLLASLSPLLLVFFCGCTSLPDYLRNGFKVGPNYVTPPAPIAHDWIDADDKRMSKDTDDLSKWWKNFDDPVLDDMICAAYQQNLTLREAGFRILQARAQLGIAVGNLFPQSQFVNGSYTSNALSGETAVNNTNNSSGISRVRNFGQWSYGFALAWEVDFWGRFRRSVESTGASLDASVHDYDDVLVTLLSDVAANYVNYRTTEQRIRYAQKNVELQERTVKVVENRKGVGVARQVDIDQARSILYQTKAAIPELEIALRLYNNQLCTLLGLPPEQLQKRLGAGHIPVTPAPENVAVGIPADLLRRRPDVRRAERQAAAQSAQIGIAESDFYPHISLDGNLGYSAQHFQDLFKAAAFNGSVGPSVQWNVLNYGRILNNVRLQDAKFQELTAGYQNKVLIAQQEVENGLVTFIKARDRAKWQKESVNASDGAVKSFLIQFEAGTVNISQVILIIQNKVQQEDTLAQSEGEIAQGLIQVYKALGGGWQIRCQGCEPQPTPAPDEATLRPEGAPPAPMASFGRPH